MLPNGTVRKIYSQGDKWEKAVGRQQQTRILRLTNVLLILTYTKIAVYNIDMNLSIGQYSFLPCLKIVGVSAEVSVFCLEIGSHVSSLPSSHFPQATLVKIVSLFSILVAESEAYQLTVGFS